MVTYFWPNLMKCPKMGSIGQIFASLLAKKAIKPHKAYYNSKRNSQEMGSFRALNLHSMTFKC